MIASRRNFDSNTFEWIERLINLRQAFLSRADDPHATDAGRQVASSRGKEARQATRKLLKLIGEQHLGVGSGVTQNDLIGAHVTYNSLYAHVRPRLSRLTLRL